MSDNVDTNTVVITGVLESSKVFPTKNGQVFRGVLSTRSPFSEFKVPVVAFKTAAASAASIATGSPVIISGSLSYNSFKGKDGTTKGSLEVVAFSFRNLGAGGPVSEMPGTTVDTQLEAPEEDMPF